MAVDEIAERIRALGVNAPGSYHAFAELSEIPEETGFPDAREMLRQLVQAQEAVARTARSVMPLADAASDEPSADLLTPAHAGARKERMDAAQPARMIVDRFPGPT